MLQVGSRLPRVLMLSIALPSHQVLGLRAPPDLAPPQHPLHLELYSRALILQGNRCRDTWIACHSLELAAVEDIVHPPRGWQLNPPGFLADFLHQPERSRPLGSQLLAANLQGKVGSAEPHLVSHQEWSSTTVAIRLLLHPCSRHLQSLHNLGVNFYTSRN